jgi:hypothetical protein
MVDRAIFGKMRATARQAHQPGVHLAQPFPAHLWWLTHAPPQTTLNQMLQKIMRTPHIYLRVSTRPCSMNNKGLTVASLEMVIDRIPGIHSKARKGTMKRIHRVITDALIR